MVGSMDYGSEMRLGSALKFGHTICLNHLEGICNCQAEMTIMNKKTSYSVWW